MKRTSETNQLQSFIDRCFGLAEEARRRGDTPVGSLLVGADGEILAEASERNLTEDLFAHAELLAIQAAVKILQTNDLSGFTLITTNEPCFLCSYAVRQTRISRVVFAIETLETGGYSSNYPILAADDIGHWGAAPEILKAAEFLPPNAK